MGGTHEDRIWGDASGRVGVNQVRGMPSYLDARRRPFLYLDNKLHEIPVMNFDTGRQLLLLYAIECLDP